MPIRNIRVDVICLAEGRADCDAFFSDLWNEPQTNYCSVPLNATGNPCGDPEDPSTWEDPENPDRATHYASSGLYSREEADAVLTEIADPDPLFAGFEDDGTFPQGNNSAAVLYAWTAANLGLQQILWP